jgi:hypothetical protein
MLGCWLKDKNRWLEAESQSPGMQKLTYRKSSYPSKQSGTHRLFWEAYYDATSHLSPWLGPKEVLAVTPFKASKTWLSDTRNRLNYDSSEAFALMQDFSRRFDPARIPGCFPGTLGSMLTLASSFLVLAAHLANTFGLSTDLYQPNPPGRIDALRAHSLVGVDPALVAYAHQEAEAHLF